MKQYRLTASKTKLAKLLREFGYNPPAQAHFCKAFRRSSWWLEWFDGIGTYRAFFSAAAGRAFLGIRYNFSDDYGDHEKWDAHTLTPEVLDKFNLREEIKNEKCKCGS